MLFKLNGASSAREDNTNQIELLIIIILAIQALQLCSKMFLINICLLITNFSAQQCHNFLSQLKCARIPASTKLLINIHESFKNITTFVQPYPGSAVTAGARSMPLTFDGEFTKELILQLPSMMLLLLCCNVLCLNKKRLYK